MASPTRPNHSNSSTELVFLLIENPSKSNNLGPILRCAAAFDVEQVIFVGYEKCSVEGSHGSAKHLSIEAFPTFAQAESYLRRDHFVRHIYGLMGGAATDNDAFFGPQGVPVLFSSCVESDQAVVRWSTDELSEDDGDVSILKKRSYPVHVRPFEGSGNVCFFVSKNNLGIPKHQAEVCDRFLHVPLSPVPYVGATVATEMLDEDESPSGGVLPPPYRFVDVQSCLSIALHHYTSWSSRYRERTFVGTKFKVDDRYQLDNQPEKWEEKKSKRKMDRQKAEQVSENVLDGGWGDFFSG